MDLNEEHFWAAWRVLRDRERASDDDDLLCVLMGSEEFWRRLRASESKAAAYDAMRAAYERAGTSKEKQAAACRAGGLTKTDGSAGARDRRSVVDRWYELTRPSLDADGRARRPLPDRNAALSRLAAELEIDDATMARTLRRFRDELKKLIHEGDPFSDRLRIDLEALSTGPARIPSGTSKKVGKLGP